MSIMATQNIKNKIMKTVYEASNAIEAHMLLDLLKQEGVTAQIHGEYLQGGIGELPASGFVRLVVEEADYEQARAAIVRWDESQPTEEVVPQVKPPARRATVLRGFVLGLAIGVAGAYAYFQSPVKVTGIDLNGDGILDEKWTHAPSGTVMKSELDRNLDGKIDYIVHFDRHGLLATAESDDNFDGVFETKIRFHLNNIETAEVDTDGDGYRDLVSHYTNGILSSVDFVNPATALNLRVEYYKLGKITMAELDTNKDGTLDTRYFYNVLGEISATEKIIRK